MFDPQDFAFLFNSVLRTGRVLVPVAVQEATVLALAMKTELDQSLSRLFAIDADVPVRYYPPAHIPQSWVFDERASRYVKPEPKYFFSGDGTSKSRVLHKRHSYKSFAQH